MHAVIGETDRIVMTYQAVDAHGKKGLLFQLVEDSATDTFVLLATLEGQKPTVHWRGDFKSVSEYMLEEVQDFESDLQSERANTATTPSE